MSYRARALLSVLAVTLACGSDAPVEPAASPPSMQIIAGGTGADTVETVLDPPLTVEVRTGASPSPGVAVQFSRIDASTKPTLASISVSKPGQADFQSALTVLTDPQGRASVTVRLGTTARVMQLQVTCTSCSAVDTAEYSVRAGAATRLATTVRDTGVVIGDTYFVSGQTADRFGNGRVDHVTVASTSPLVTVDSSGVVQVGDQTGSGVIIVRAGTLSDSSRFVVRTGPTIAAVAPTNSARGDSAAYIVTTTLNGLRSRILTVTGYEPAYPVASPTADLVAYQRADNGMQVYVVDGAGTNRRVVTSAQLIETCLPRFAPDGQTIFFTARTSTSYGIWRVNMDGTALALVTPTGSGFRAPAPSPDGLRLAYARDDGMVIRTLASGVEVPVGPVGEFPVFSPDGQHLAWLGPTGDLYVVDADGASLTQIRSFLGGTNSGLTWLSNERLLARGGSGVTSLNISTRTTAAMPKLGGYYQLFATP